MKPILISLFTLITFYSFSQIKINNTEHSTVFIDVIKGGETKLLRMDVCGTYEDINHLMKEKPKSLRLVFDNNTYIQLPFSDDNFIHDDYRFYYYVNFYLNKENQNLLETFIIKEWVLNFKYFQVSEEVKTKKGLKFYYHINSKCDE
jgi:hypothetical protein